MPSTEYSSDQVMSPEQAFELSLRTVLAGDDVSLVKARKNYGESWCKRGGVGAFMMLARKWDRLENYLSNPPLMGADGLPDKDGKSAFAKWDILAALLYDKRPEGIADDVRDLRRYLALVEAKIIEGGHQVAEVKKDIVDTRHVGSALDYNWSKVPDWVNYIATDEDSDVYGYEEPPVKGTGRWGGVGATRVRELSSTVSPLDSAWGDSLRSRPKKPVDK